MDHCLALFSETGRPVGGLWLGLLSETGCPVGGSWLGLFSKKEVIQFWLQIIQSIEFDGKKLRKIRNRSLKDGINFCLLCKAMTATESLISRFSCLLFGTLLDV